MPSSWTDAQRSRDLGHVLLPLWILAAQRRLRILFAECCWPIKCRGRHRCIERRAFGCRPQRTCRSERRGGNPSILASGYAVQVTSERSEGGAQAAFLALQAKYPIQLSGRHPIIRRADLGAAGIYYRALVGPLRSAEEAKKLCSGLKAAGAKCIIQKN